MTHIPVGYQRPNFPGLYWPLGSDSVEFRESYLYSFKDIWMFTTIWAMIFMCGLYTCAALLFLFTHHVGSISPNRESTDSVDEANTMSSYLPRSANIQSYFVDTMLSGKLTISGYIIAIYIVMGSLQGFIAGSAVGCMIGGIYNSGQFKVTTWIPFAFGLVISVFNIVSSYSFTVKTL
ncbi:hypothetical protein CANINC_001001 [Pichia inconspicua]|uniref:Uncharacterized protein n=1 Tax=Pichia inconspicua TaxID=52247 RepID=A0A4V6TTT0_9ASCO|nr:hypothetical protein CANINC_001001 [[Candida] inconspicua]